MRRKLIYFCQETEGGIADYSVAQAEAIARQGVDLIFLTRPSFKIPQHASFRVIEALQDPPFPLSQNLWLRRFQQLRALMKNLAILRGLILSLHVKEVLWSSFFEYGAPFWAGHFRDLVSHGVQMGAILHDPVRDYQIGPRWWHRKSIESAKPLFHRFFYHTIPREIQDSTNLFHDPYVARNAAIIPHGLYHFPPPSRTREEMRNLFDLPKEAQVWLVFGHLRDGKNLDLILEALKASPHDYLWVVGREQSSGQKSLAFYQEWAEQQGVADRVRWVHEHLPENLVGDFFIAADALFLTYSKNFHSSSGVLSLAVRYRRPVIASGGESALTQEVMDYRLGHVVEADSVSAIRDAMHQGDLKKIDPEWTRYEEDHSWDENARRVLAAMVIV